GRRSRSTTMASRGNGRPSGSRWSKRAHPGPTAVPRALPRSTGRPSGAESLGEGFAGLQLADPDLLPAHLVGAGSVLDRVDLEADESLGVAVVHEVGTGDAVDPRADPRPLRDDPGVVPLAVHGGAAGGGVGPA